MQDRTSFTSSEFDRLAPGGALAVPRDLPLGVPGFSCSDLHDPRRLADLTREFDRWLAAADPGLFGRFEAWRREPASLDAVATSNLQIEVAGHLGRFVARLFGIEAEVDRLASETRAQDPIFVFKREFLQRRAFRKYGDGRRPAESFAVLDRRVRALRAAIAPAADLEADPELATARLVADLLALEGELQAMTQARGAPRAGEASVRTIAGIRSALAPAPDTPPIAGDAGPAADLDLVGRALSILEDWSVARLHDPDGRAAVRSWVSYREAGEMDHRHLVRVEHPDAALPGLMVGPRETRRRRDGFRLTDRRMSPREVLDQARYCVLCHERGKDSCAKGMMAKDGTVRRNPLGIPLAGCPLGEKISEAHTLKRRGDSLAALAMVCVDNPMCPGTGHRICNDCMKACIFQKQEPVNIPQVETGVLTDVLSLPFGFEIWSLLTRWNPLNPARPHALPYNGRNVLVVGLGPAGYTLTHYLLNEGFGVVGIDGLKIEPLPADLTGADGLPPRPVRDIRELVRDLDERPLRGFGGVSEYGITVRWDKNFLTMIHLDLVRRRNVRFYGGVRFGGTLTAEEAWEAGFDHIAIAAGAGRPTIIDMKNNVSRGIRKASDFLMALQLTGAFRREAIANLEARIPAVVVGGGLTAIDAATELLAYYPLQVEKILERWQAIAASIGEDRLRADFTPEELAAVDTYLAHARAVRAERDRAARAGETPDLAALVDSWGGVTIAYRRALIDSPAYRLNHEEVVKALEEGIRFAECLEPEEAVDDEHGALREVVFRRLRPEGDRLVDSGEKVRLPARTLLVAAGTSPNIMYEKERPGTMALDPRRQFFLSHRAVRGADGRVRLEPVPPGSGEAGFFTSYDCEGRFLSYFGDNHPRYAGNVVKAMASARDGHARIVELFADDLRRLDPRDQPARDDRLKRLFRRLDDELRPRVVEVRKLTDTIVEVTVRAPRQARNFRPGQFFRLQNYDATAVRRRGTPLLMEPLALTGAWVDRSRGVLGLIALELGVSSRLCALLKPGEEVVLMGPTGTPTEVPERSTVILAGGGLGNAVLFSIARAAKERGCRVIYFAGYKKSADLFKREEIEEATDVVVWSVDRGAPIPPRRPQDRTFVGNIVQAMTAYARGDLGKTPIRLDEAGRIIAIGSDRMMAAVTRARHEVLKPYLRADHVGIGSINSPMQCMMKEVCAQCLQRHVDPATGRESFVFSCFNQDQPLDSVDWAHLRERLEQNTVQEKLAARWLDALLPYSGTAPVYGR